MLRGFTFGKYYPFHKGHEALINYALSKCEEVIVLVCASQSETIPGALRAEWIRRSFPDLNRLKIEVYNYSETDLPNTSESSEEVSKVWAEEFLNQLPKVDYVITSEKYGDYVAQYMGIEPLSFNLERNHHPISSTLIRNDLHTTWSFLPSGVKSSFLKKVIILGSESTGKSSLCKLLSEHYNCDYVPEVARSINDQSNECTMADLATIANAHAIAIEEISQTAKSPLLIIDTDINITQSYAQFLFQQNLDLTQGIIEANKADLYLYLDNDCPHVQDGTRLNKNDRDLLHLSHQKTLQENGIDYVVISGDWESRFSKSIEYIDDLIKNNQKWL